MNIIETLEKEEADRLAAKRATPDFQPGDTVRVNVRIKEGERDGRGRRRSPRGCRGWSARFRRWM